MEEELDIREILATGKGLDELIVRASYDRKVLNEVIKYLDDDLWIVQKNALIVIMNVIEEHEELMDPLVRKLFVMVRKSEAVPLTLEIARTIGLISKIKPDLIQGMVPVILANYRIGDPKIRINMAYILEEIMRNNPKLLGNIVREIASMLTSPDEMDRLVALNFISALADNHARYVTPFLPRLLSLLYDKNEIVRVSAVETLTELAVKNPKLRKIIKAKLQELDDQSEVVMEKVKEGLTKIALVESEEEGEAADQTSTSP